MKNEKMSFSIGRNNVCDFTSGDDLTTAVLKIASILITLKQQGYGSNQYYADLLGHKFDFKDILLIEYIKHNLDNEGVIIPETEEELLKLSDEIEQENSLLNNIKGILESEAGKAKLRNRDELGSRSRLPVKFDPGPGNGKDLLALNEASSISSESRFCG